MSCWVCVCIANIKHVKLCFQCSSLSSLMADRNTEKKENVALHGDYVFDNIFMHTPVANIQLINP